MDNDLLKRSENNDIVDHLEAIREIISHKCARCNGNASGCMGCLFDSLDLGMIPALLDKALDLMALLPNDRQEMVRSGRKRHRERKAKWREIQGEKNED